MYGYLPSRSRPVATSYAKPRIWSLCAMNGLAFIRAIDWRTSAAGSLNGSAAHYR
jgi:hypothetical protein